MKYHIKDTDKRKEYRSEDYNFSFNKATGMFYRWGKTLEDDPERAPSPEILDIEISSGRCNGGCNFCYKANENISKEVKYMSLETYKKVFSKLNLDVLSQIAFGITYLKANPDFWDIVKFTRASGVVPNYTTNGIDLTDEEVLNTKEYCGAVAVSIYQHTKDIAYSAIKRYTDAGMVQTNAHFMLSEETYDFAFEVLNDIKNKVPELSKLNAIVFLQYKDKNPNSKHHTLTDLSKFKKIVDFCIENNINFGFDSCSSSLFMKSILGRDNEKALIQSVDNCESNLFSLYINVDGIAFPCSFVEDVVTGVDVLNVSDFRKEVWNSENFKGFRDRLLNSSKDCNCKFAGTCRTCPAYDISYCKNKE